MEIIEYNGYTIKIEQDDGCESPRDCDNLGTMVCWHRRYRLGDEQPSYKPSECLSELPKGTIVIPLYMYDHSGISISCTPFSCPWDSGQIGFIYVTLECIRKEYSVKRVSKVLKEKVMDILRAEVETYNQYLKGDVYRYTVAIGDTFIDSCAGFYGYDDCLDEAKHTVDWDTKRLVKLLANSLT